MGGGSAVYTLSILTAVGNQVSDRIKNIRRCSGVNIEKGIGMSPSNTAALSSRFSGVLLDSYNFAIIACYDPEGREH